MADFLTRLAERTLGVAPMVQPIFAPVFAPEPRLANEFFSFQQEGDSEVQSMIALRPARRVQNFQPDDMSFDMTQGNITPDDAKLNLPPALVPLQGYRSPELGVSIDRYEYVDSSHFENFPDEYPSPVAPSNVSAMNTHDISDRGMITPNLNVSPKLAIREGSPVPRIEFLPGREGSSVPMTESLDYDMFAKTRKTIIGMPLRGTQDTVLPVQNFESSAPEKSTYAPTIRVTIGRIEVRAVMSTNEPAARPTSTRPKLKLSLDDYLKQQNGG